MVEDAAKDAAKDAERIPLGELITLLPAWRSWAGASAAGGWHGSLWRRAGVVPRMRHEGVALMRHLGDVMGHCKI